MKGARPTVASAGIGLGLTVILTAVFIAGAIQLSSAQTSQRSEIKTEVHDRAVLSATLIESLFKTVDQNTALYRAQFGGFPGSSLAQAALQTDQGSDAYAVVVNAGGQVLAHSSGYNGRGLAVTTQQLALAERDPFYYLGNLEPYAGRMVLDLAVSFPGVDGPRFLVTGIPLPALASFFGNELSDVPGVAGERNYVLDGDNRILGTSGRRHPAGSVLAVPGAASAALSGQYGSTFYEAAPLLGSTWRVVLVAPAAALFASVDGAHEVVPWVIFAALVVMAAIALLLGFKVLSSAAEVRDANDRLAEVNGQLVVANEALQRRAAELARSNEELDSFASIASHDLQEPLRKVRTFNEQLTVLDGDHLSERGRDYLARSNAAAERMQNLIEDLLRFSRVSTQGRRFETVDLGQVLAGVLDDLAAPIAEAGARIHADLLPSIVADPLQMQQLLQNLLSNAVKFRREGVAPEIGVTATLDGSRLRLEVSDNGIGFEPRYSARIFRIFERLNGRSAYPGTGIGLALCRKIADRHGGTIEAVGRPGEGATFIVTLPIHQPEGSYGFGSQPVDLAEAGAGV